MNRSFKFRIYSFFDKSFHYFSIENYPQGIYGGVSIPFQHTGVNDKNKKEIYEGDFLKDFEFPVKFEKGAFFVGIRYDLIDIPLYELNEDELEIIGNIFETPELLKKI